MFFFSNDDPDDVVQYLGLSCNKNKHHSTILEACSTWTMRLEKRGRKDIYAKLSFTWPNDIYYIQCSDSRKKEVIRDLVYMCMSQKS